MDFSISSISRLADAIYPALLAYLVGTVGILLEWRSYYLPSGKEFRRWSAMGALLWALQYMLLGAWTAGLNMAVTAFRTVLSGLQAENFFKHASVAGFISIFSALTYLSWQGYISLLPAFAVINTTLALYYLNNRNMRIALLASSMAWIINDVYWQAWTALLAESVAIGINIRTIRKILLNQ